MSKEIWIEADLWNLSDEQEVSEEKKKPAGLRCKVDNGSWHCVLPESIADELSLPRRDRQMVVTYADGRKAERAVGLGLRLRIQDRDIETYAIIEPRRTSVLIGSIALEDFGFDIDMANGCLKPYPGTESGQCTVIE